MEDNKEEKIATKDGAATVCAAPIVTAVTLGGACLGGACYGITKLIKKDKNNKK